MASSQSTYTVQNVNDDLEARGDLEPELNRAGWSTQPILQICTTVMQEFCGGTGMFPWKWNEFILPVFYLNSWQQDYALPGVTNLAWLNEGLAVQINNPTTPKPSVRIEVGRNQQRNTGGYFPGTVFSTPLVAVNYLPNNVLYYGTWGAAQYGNETWGNNPVAGSVYTNPLGNGNAQPSNPITQIQDANGNYLVLTTYGTEGSAAPVATPNAAPGTTASGTGASTVWTVIDPYGQGIRVTTPPSQTGVVWQFNLVGQMKPVKFNSMSQTLFPLTDDFYQHFLDGCVAQAYRYATNPRIKAQFKDAHNLWLNSTVEMRRGEDREKEEYRIIPGRSVMQAGGTTSGYLGGAWPFNYPIT